MDSIEELKKEIEEIDEWMRKLYHIISPGDTIYVTRELMMKTIKHTAIEGRRAQIDLEQIRDILS